MVSLHATVASQHGAPSIVHVCRECGLQTLWPPPLSGVLRDYYAEPLPRTIFQGEVIGGRDINARDPRVARVADPLIKRYRPGRILDVGCGFGFQLAAFKRAGWDCTGLEVNELFVRYARASFGLRVLPAGIEDMDAALGGERFDLVLIGNLLHLVSAPLDLLRAAGQRLAAGGVLAVVVPNELASYRHRVFRSAVPYRDDKLFYFDRRSIERLLVAADFCPGMVWTWSLSGLGDVAITALGSRSAAARLVAGAIERVGGAWLMDRIADGFGWGDVLCMTATAQG